MVNKVLLPVGVFPSSQCISCYNKLESLQHASWPFMVWLAASWLYPTAPNAEFTLEDWFYTRQQKPPDQGQIAVCLALANWCSITICEQFKDAIQELADVNPCGPHHRSLNARPPFKWMGGLVFSPQRLIWCKYRLIHQLAFQLLWLLTNQLMVHLFSVLQLSVHLPQLFTYTLIIHWPLEGLCVICPKQPMYQLYISYILASNRRPRQFCI